MKAGARPKSTREGGSVSRLLPVVSAAAGVAREPRSRDARPEPPAMREEQTRPAGPASPSCARGGRGVRASPHRVPPPTRAAPRAPAAPPVPHSISKIIHTCAGKQARESPGPRVPDQPMQRAPSSRTCRPAPPAGFCAARPRPRPPGPAPPSGPRPVRLPPPPRPEALAPAAPAGASPPRSRKFLALPERAAQVRSLPPFPSPRTIHPL